MRLRRESRADHPDWHRSCKNPRVPDAQKPRCTDYCNCVIDEGQKLFSENEYQQIERDFAARNETPRVKQFQGLSQPCNVRAFSR